MGRRPRFAAIPTKARNPCGMKMDAGWRRHDEAVPNPVFPYVANRAASAILDVWYNYTDRRAV
jgi:hypothetical protein